VFEIILFQPEIPPNTGNIIRLCANTGAKLHLIKPLGFTLEDKQLLRAGLDYHEFASLAVHENWQDCMAKLHGRRLFAVSTKGKRRYDAIDYVSGDTFRPGKSWSAGRNTGKFPRTKSYPHPHAAGEPQLEFIQCGCSSGI